LKKDLLIINKTLRDIIRILFSKNIIFNKLNFLNIEIYLY